MKKLFSILAAVVIMSLCACTLSAQQAQAPAKLPDVEIFTADGNAVSAASLSNGGKPMLVSFFATWCGPCRRELGAIAPLLKQWEDETGVKLVIVSLDEPGSTQTVLNLVESIDGLDRAELYFDTNSEFASAMGVSGIPHMLYVDGEGNVADTTVGFAPGHEDEILNRVKEIAAKK